MQYLTGFKNLLGLLTRTPKVCSAVPLWAAFAKFIHGVALYNGHFPVAQVFQAGDKPPRYGTVKKELVSQPSRLIKLKATNKYGTSETLVLPTPTQKPHE